MKHFIFLLAGVVIFGSGLFAQVSPDPNFHVYICFGQSNMEGPAEILEEDTTDIDPRFKVLTVFDEDYEHLGRSVGEWYTAKPPLCRWYTGLGPYDYFGRTLVDSLPDSAKVGVIVVAMGGSGIDAFDKDNYVEYYANADAWQKGLMNGYDGCPYAKIVEMAKIAQQSGVIKGILLHQGESNNGQPDWPLKVQKIYYDLLEDLDITPDTVPLLVGEMLSQEEGGICWGHNNIIANLPFYVPNTQIISSAECPGVDDFHFTHEGMVKLGTRYGQQMWTLLKTYDTEEGQTVDHLVLEDTVFTLLTGAYQKIPLIAAFVDGHTQDIRFRATYEISNPEAIQITNGYIETINDGSATITASYKGAVGEQKQVVFNVTASTFPLNNELLNADIFGDGSFDETTKSLQTAQWGFGGWQYNNGIDMSGYKYLVVQLGTDNNAGIEFKLFDGQSYWGASTSSKFENSREVVVYLENQKKSDGTIIDPSHIYIAGFWSDGSNPFVIDTIFLSNSSVYDPPVINVRDIDENEIEELEEFSYYQGAGPSPSQSFTVSGTLLVDDVLVKAPTGFEVSLNSKTGYGQTVTLTVFNRLLTKTTVHVRLKSGLTRSSYKGKISLTSPKAFTKYVTVSGAIATNIGSPVKNSATVISTEYYTLTGQKIYNIENRNGLFIEKKFMSDGSIINTKIFKGDNY